ncbi:prepilin-type N-terminal cleavage/methylation domain-containing protein [Algisphaera agarilytica]|uniref:Prepilin-type N-terminal cleavage/methylation domain-containing protein n=1 Tax=Algisphaera agarilytica TaxID=1385975 RepID=A0A7X0H8Y4_9BACT|nr:prepilin-type N-terminal cleavage/methylation domain-containing protein [Algisphaera agarilytica]MBB6431472.1 prepilin-type N-terminal cleavage/methylation domain-containing protein [Algisphaera agarilytica]
MRNTLASSRAGFSLIEILVVISIIALLLALGAVGMSKMREQAQVEKIRVLLQQLAGVETEYRAQTNGKFPDDDSSNSSTAGVNNSIEWFVEQVEAQPITQEMIEKTVNRAFYSPTDGGTPGTVVDAWGLEIEYRELSDGSATATSNGTNAQFPPYAQPFFASAGPDGLWGDHSVLADPDDAAADNIYSFELP